MTSKRKSRTKAVPDCTAVAIEALKTVGGHELGEQFYDNLAKALPRGTHLREQDISFQHVISEQFQTPIESISSLLSYAEDALPRELKRDVNLEIILCKTSKELLKEEERLSKAPKRRR
jgi:hypothetical protein